jgi:hypothetical protein
MTQPTSGESDAAGRGGRGGLTSEACQHLAASYPADLLGVGLEHRVAHGDLSIADHHHVITLLDDQNGR